MKSQAQLLEDNGITIIDRLMQSNQDVLTADVARWLLSLKFPAQDERLMNQLAARARRGNLTDREIAVSEQYNLISHLLALIQAKALQAISQECLPPLPH